MTASAIAAAVGDARREGRTWLALAQSESVGHV